MSTALGANASSRGLDAENLHSGGLEDLHSDHNDIAAVNCCHSRDIMDGRSPSWNCAEANLVPSIMMPLGVVGEFMHRDTE
jgi:hypothetical protein